VPQPTKPSRLKVSKTNGHVLPTRLSAQVEIAAKRHQSLDRSALHLLLAVYRCFATLDRNQQEEVRKVGLTVTQFNLLTTLERVSRPVSMGEMAAMMVLQPTNLSGIVNGLAKRGLVRREVSALDQRSFLVSLMPAGQRLLDGFLPDHWRHLESIMSGLSEGERVTLVNLLRKLMHSINDADGAVPGARTGAAAPPVRLRTRAHGAART